MHTKHQKLTICPNCESDYLKPIHKDHDMKLTVGLEWFVCGACGKSFYSKKRFSTSAQSNISTAETEKCFRFYRA